MTAPVITVTSEATVRDLARLLAEKRISGVPVVDADGRVIGLVTEADLMVRVSGPHLPAHIELLGGIIYLESPQQMNEDLRKAMAATARDIMSRDVVTVAADATVQSVADVMVRRKLNRVPVVDAAGKLQGIITRHDIIATLVGTD